MAAVLQISGKVRRGQFARSVSVNVGEVTQTNQTNTRAPKLCRRQLSDDSGQIPDNTRDTRHSKRLQRLNMPVVYRLYESQCDEYRGTVFGPDDEDFRPEEASKSLRQALGAGIQCDDKVIINCLLKHTNFQRQKIVAAYEGMYNRSLATDIEDIAGGFFLDCTLALLQPAHVYSTRLLHFAISGKSFNRPVAVEIALTSNASQLKVIRDAYYSEYGISLERDLNLKVEGAFGQMLKYLLIRTKDYEHVPVDLDYIDSIIDLIHKSENGIDEISRNLELFEKIFVNQGLNQLRVFFDRFDTQAMRASDPESPKARDFESAVRKSVNIHTDVRTMLLLFVKISRNIQLYFAEKLHEAIMGARSDHATLIRILVSRSELDLADICDEYRRRFGRSIMIDLKNTCSGDFYRLLKRLIDPHNNNASFEEGSETAMSPHL